MSTYLIEASASVESVSRLVAWAEDAASEHADLSPESINVLLVCLQELIANVAMHANRGHDTPTVRVDLTIEAGRIAVLIEDDGGPFDPITGAPHKSDTDLAAAKTGGRGLRIVRHLARSMSYARQGEWNRVKLDIV